MKLVLTFILLNNQLLVGIMEDNVMVGPRLVTADHDTGVINLSPLMGNPACIHVNPRLAVYQYDNADPALTEFYQNEVLGSHDDDKEPEGLSIVKP
jgi:hypothetical protein